MYKNMRIKQNYKTSINTTRNLREGQSIEEVMRINTANKVQPAPILPELYQKRNEGIDPLCDVRTDKFEMAMEAMDKVTRLHLLASQNKNKMGKADNTWITDEDGKPLYDNPLENNKEE